MDTGQRNPMHFGPGIGPPTAPGSVGDGTGGGVYQYDGLVNMQQVHLKSSNLQAVLSGTAGNYGNGFQQGARQTTITNMPENIPMGTYVGNSGQGGTLPPMGSFIAGVDQHSMNSGQCVAAGYKPGMEGWVNQGQGLQQALPSFGHFLSMHPNQVTNQQEQSLNQTHGQTQGQGQQMVSGASPQLYHCSPNRFQNNFLQPQCIGPPGMGQHVAQNFLGGGMIGNFGFQSHSIGNVNMGMKMNVNMGMMSDLNSGGIIGGRLGNHPHHASPIQGGVNMVSYSNQPPNMSMNVSPVSPYYFVPSRSSAATGCNQITNTTTTITTTASSSLGTVSTAHVHSKKSIASATTSKLQTSTSMQGQSSLSPTQTDSEMSTVQRKVEDCTSSTPTPVSKIDDTTKPNKTDSILANGAMSSESNIENRMVDDQNLLQNKSGVQYVIVPFGWKRVVEEGSVVYYR